MFKIGVADFGLNQWDGALYDYKSRFEMLGKIGFNGLERLEAKNAAEALEISADAKRYGMDFTTCRGTCAMETLRWTAALGKKYIWTESQSADFEVFCRQVNKQSDAAGHYGVKVAVHNHLGLVVETQRQLEDFLEKCPECGMVFDVGHFAAAGGDPIYIIENYADRLVAVHLKDYVIKDENAKNWWDRLRFCELGAGVMGGLNEKILTALKKSVYNGWLLVEHDTHLREPAEDLAISYQYIINSLRQRNA